MLSIGKLAAGQQRYYERQVAQGRDDYYSGKGEAPGEWVGRGAGLLGLGGRVGADRFNALIAGINPADPQLQEVLRDRRVAPLVAAYDLTFSAPKSVSVLFATADEETSGELIEAHEAAVRNATTVPGRNVTFENCLFEGLWSPLLSIAGSADVTFKHVTAIGGTVQYEAATIGGYSAANERFRLENNILQNNEFGLNCSLGSTGACYPNYAMTGNVILDNRSPAKKVSAGPLSNQYPAGNLSSRVNQPNTIR